MKWQFSKALCLKKYEISIFIVFYLFLSLNVTAYIEWPFSHLRNWSAGSEERVKLGVEGEKGKKEENKHLKHQLKGCSAVFKKWEYEMKILTPVSL